MQATQAGRKDLLQALISEFKREKQTPKANDKPYTLKQMFATQRDGLDSLMTAFRAKRDDLALIMLQNAGPKRTKLLWCYGFMVRGATIKPLRKVLYGRNTVPRGP